MDKLTPGINLPCSILVALQDATSWIYFNEENGGKETVEMQMGDLLIFTADTVHAGAAYESCNYRIHAYFTVRGSPIEEDEPPDFCNSYTDRSIITSS